MYAIRSYYGYEYRGELPFKNVYYTGIVRDKLGRKMSKSLGNSPDPIQLMEEYGADGVRVITSYSIHYTKLYE